MFDFAGLDPAGPWFPLNETDTRLDITDADFVDIIHTNSGNLSEDEWSFLEPIGHVDFYPNGGQQQPGCPVANSSQNLDYTRSKKPKQSNKSTFNNKYYK